MNQEEDEDAFLYGDPGESAAAARPSASSAPRTIEEDMEPESEEGEIDDEEKRRIDSVVTVIPSANNRTSNLLSKQNLESELHHHRISIQDLPLITTRSAQPFALRLTSQSRPPPQPPTGQHPPQTK